MRKLNRIEYHTLWEAAETLQSLAFEGDERRADYSAEEAVSPSAAFEADLLSERLESFMDLHADNEYPGVLAHLAGPPDLVVLQLMRNAGHVAVAWQAVGGVVMQPLLWECGPFIVPNWEVAGDLAKAMCRS